MNKEAVTKKPKQFYHHLHKTVFKKNQLPSYLIFYPTSRCNLKCSHCFYHESLNKRFKELTLDEIRAFTSTMDPLLSLILTGGEPYLRHDLDQIVKIFYENTRVPIVTIPSNGWYLEKMEKQIKNMMKWCPDLVLNQLISIDGLEEDHCKIRGHKDSFSKAIEATKLVKKIQKETNRVNLGIQTTFTSQNQTKMKDIVKGIFEIAKPDNITIALVRGNPKEKAYYDYMLSYSPYDQVKAQNYPNILVTTGLHDSQVQYFEPMKWVAKLRDYKTDDNVLLFKTDMEAGHGGASGRFKRIHDTALQYSFFIDLLNKS